MLLRLIVPAGLVLATTLAAQPVTLGLLPPGHAVTGGGVATVELIVLNRTETAQEYTALELLPARLTTSTKSWNVVLRATGPGAGPPTAIMPGGFISRSYVFTVPDDATGRAIIDAQPGPSAPVRAVLDVAAPEGKEPVTRARPITNLARAIPAASFIQRTLANRLAPHEPIYFIYGPDAPAAKFQLSFKYRLHDLPGLARLRWTRSLQLAFTQRSLWDIDGPSSPFYDTSYIPEVIFESLAPMPERSDHWFTWLGYGVAFKHESNGRGGPDSRSLNTVYLRPAFALGALDGWHLLVAPEVFTYVSSLEDNSDLKDYRGYGQLRLVLGRNDGPSLMAAIWAGRKLNHASMQLDLTFPIRTKLLNFETYLLVQYFNGYGESLLSYRDQTESVRAGISLVR